MRLFGVMNCIERRSAARRRFRLSKDERL